MNYRESERERQIGLLKTTDLFYHGESGFKLKGKGKEYDEILLDGTNNIFKPVQQAVLEYFHKNDISFWHVPNEPVDKPTGHILSSQVSCINHLFPIRQDKEAVLKIAKTVCADFTDVLPITTDKYEDGYIQFEAVSDKGHLNERSLSRGTNCTSIDALIYAVHTNGKKYIIPIEWKYTEVYGNKDYSTKDRKGEPKGNELTGKERLKRYSELIDNSKFLKHLPSYRNSVYFHESFYQLMRQTLWAEQIIKHSGEERIKADDFIHVHVIPSENHKLLDSVKQVWPENLTDKERYKIIAPKDLIKNIDKAKYTDLIKYISARYWSID
jgi:hypothetical protein